jgi:hypothetical protein
MPSTIAPPQADEYADFHKGYMAAVAGEPDAVAVLERQQQVIEAMRGLSTDQAGYRYEEGKWSVREVIGHLIDAERITTYRLLCIARGDQTQFPGFDEQSYAAISNAERRPLVDLIDELAAVRKATVCLVRSLDEESLARRGNVNAWTLTPRSIAYITAGHFQHHVGVLRERYALAL